MNVEEEIKKKKIKLLVTNKNDTSKCKIQCK